MVAEERGQQFRELLRAEMKGSKKERRHKENSDRTDSLTEVNRQVSPNGTRNFSTRIMMPYWQCQ